MNFIKKWFNRIVGWIATASIKLEDKINQYFVAPFRAMSNGIDIEWTPNMVGKVVLGALLMIADVVLVSASVILSIAGLTLVLAIVLPALLANVLAVVITGYLVYQVALAARQIRAIAVTTV